MEETKTIGKDYTLMELARFCLPTIVNETFISLLYTIDDGLFISRYIGPNALAAFSILLPVFMLHGAISSLFGGVSMLASYKMGEKKIKEAESDFTCIVLFMLVLGVFVGAVERIFIRQLLKILGCTELIYPHAEAFLKVGALYTPLTLVSNTFMRFYVPAGKPKMQLFSSVVNVSLNVFLDWYFVAYLGVGMVGTAYANMIAVVVMIIIALIFFSGRHCELGFARPQSRLVPLIKESSKYGISSFLSNLSVGLGTIVSNYAVLHWGSEQYLAAYSIVNNIQFVFIGSFFGLLGTTGPLISYAFGEKNREKLNRLFRQLVILLAMLSGAIIMLFVVFGPMIAELYISESARDSKDLINLGMSIAPYSFVFFGYNVAARMTFSALGNHKASAILTFLSEVFFSNLFVVMLPMLFTIKGIWFSFLITNIVMFAATLYFVYRNRDNYGYGKSGKALMIK
ncbi:MAG: hypothetical protein IKX97_00425 [Erysipelotrichaceae bacterium]|nr:hypothetical protein [Erysipelotrichaceae bacterium]